MQAASSNIARSIPIAQAATPLQAGSGKPTMFTDYELPQAPVPIMPQRDDLPAFLGEVTPGVGGVDYVDEVYVNEAGATETFRRYTDGRLLDKNGNEAVIPEGYTIKSEAEKDVGTGPVKVETATVQDEGDSGDNQEDDGLGPGGARVAWGGTTQGAKKGLKVGSTQVGIGYTKVDPITGQPVTGLSGIPTILDFANVLGGVTVGGELPSGYAATATLDNVITAVSNVDFNAAKKAGYMGQNADTTLDVINRNVAAANILEGKYGLRARTQPTTVENIAREAMKTQAGLDQIGKDYDLNATGGTYKQNLESLTSAINAKNRAAYAADDRFSVNDAKDFSTDDIIDGAAARAAIDAQNAAVNAKAAAQRAADRDSGGDGGGGAGTAMGSDPGAGGNVGDAATAERGDEGYGDAGYD